MLGGVGKVNEKMAVAFNLADLPKVSYMSNNLAGFGTSRGIEWRRHPAAFSSQDLEIQDRVRAFREELLRLG
jgi:hypothetical protein